MPFFLRVFNNRMNTPIQTLLANSGSGSGLGSGSGSGDPKLASLSNDADPIVQDIIKDIENEVAQATAQQKQKQQMQNGNTQPHLHAQQHVVMPHHSPYSIQIQPPVPANWMTTWVDVPLMQRCVIIAVVCAAIYSNAFGTIYERIPKLQIVQSYDTFIRMFVVALLLYVIFLKFIKFKM